MHLVYSEDIDADSDSKELVKYDQILVCGVIITYIPSIEYLSELNILYSTRPYIYYVLELHLLGPYYEVEVA